MVLYHVPEEYGHRSDEFEVMLENEPLAVLSCRVSAYPFNRPWPGHQRDISQTEPGHYVRFGNDEAFTLRIRPKKPFENVVIRPLSKGIKPIIEKDGSVSALFPGKGQYTVEFDGIHDVLAVFADPEKSFDIEEDDPDTLYFGPGVHRYDEGIVLHDGQTVYIDKDAVLYGGFFAENAKDIRFLGYGILDNSDCRILPIEERRCENITVEGLTIIDTSTWALVFRGGKNIDVKGVKLYGFWRYNADGCDFCNVTDASIRDSFIRSFDDSFVVKGLKKYEEVPVDNILIENCVAWCDWGRALEIGAENCAPYIRNITFRNVDIIHGMSVMMDIQHGDSADIENVLFEDIRAEYTAKMQKPRMQRSEEEEYENANPQYVPDLIMMTITQKPYNLDDTAGMLRNVTFRDITVTTENGCLPKSAMGCSVENKAIENVFFENIVIDGKRIQNADELNMRVYSGCKNVHFEG